VLIVVTVKQQFLHNSKFLNELHSVKGILHPKMMKMNSVIVYTPSSCCKPVWVSFFCWTQRKIFWRTIGTKQFLAPL